MRFLALVLLVLLYDLGSSPSSMVSAWKSCSEEAGGGICPDETTCCPTETFGVSSCIPLVHTNGPVGKPKGQCCGDSFTGCRFGYECAVSSSSSVLETKKITRLGSTHSREIIDHQYCKATNETMVFDPLAHDTPRYDLCRIPEDMKKIYGLPVAISSDLAHLNFNSNSVDDEENDIFHLAYLSNVGPIASKRHPNSDDEPNDLLKTIEKAVIIVHGSLRDAEDYFCAGLSLIEENNNNAHGTTMIIAPKFASVNDNMEERGSSYRFLMWKDQVEAYDDFLWHIWRYGSNAVNAPISSYTALDRLVEQLVDDPDRFPNLQQITVVGHSAGGQTLQRWALLSNSPAWNTMDIKVVVANARSYAYLDGRRWLAPNLEESQGNDEVEVFRRPTPKDGIDTFCPWYNFWLWGLEDGGELLCPYRDSAVAKAGSAAAIAKRYALRNVVYLSGEYDTVPQTNDRCGNAIQGGNRHERAIRFYNGLQEYFGNPMLPVHSLYIIPNSNHDHALMFQSKLGRDAILGSPTLKPRSIATAIG